MKARNKRYAAILSVVTVLALALSLVAVPVPSFAATVVTSPFSDVTSSTSYSTAIAFLASQGVVSGYPDGTFKPGNTITRAEMAKILVELAGKDSVAQALANLTPTFKDGAQIPSWAWGYVNAASGAGYIKGYPDGTFKANAPVTDAEAFAMFIRLLGDDWTVSGPWPTNYLIAAASVGLTSGLSSFSANVPATRGEIAQLGYNAALSAQYTTTSNQNGVAVNQLNAGGLYTKNGSAITNAKVTQAGTDSLTLNNTPPPYGVESKLTVIGASSVPALLNDTVTAVVDSNGLINYVEVGAAAATTTKTLNDGTQTAAPAGFTAAYTTSDNVITAVYDANNNTYLLFSDGSTVQFTDSSTNVTVNSDVHQDKLTWSNFTAWLQPGDTVDYTVSGGVADQVNVTHYDVTDGVVTATAPAASTPTITVGLTVGQDTYKVTSSTSITLNGQAASLSQLQKYDVVSIAADANKNAISIVATRNTVTGTVLSQFGSTVVIQPSGGSPQTLPMISTFYGTVTVGQSATIALDGQQNAVAVVSAQPTNQVVRYLGAGKAYSSAASSSVDALFADNQGTTTTYTYSASANTTVSTYGAGNFFVFATQGTSQGFTYVASATYLAPVQPSSDNIVVASASSSSVTLEAVDKDTGAVDTSYSDNAFLNGYLTISAAAVYNKNGKYVGFAGLQAGDTVSVYAAKVSGTWYFAIQDQSR
ncbi:MAG: S-layer homology domain-containing protein [Chloroflexi bacterium]|nr:S-layer homology domain-containing protein [Chloroflexota bacterium]